MKIRTQETAHLYEEYEYDMGEDFQLPADFANWNKETQLLYLNRNCLDCNRVEWDYADGGTLDEYEIVE